MAPLGQYVFAEMLRGYRNISPPGAMNGSPTVIFQHFQNSTTNNNLLFCFIVPKGHPGCPLSAVNCLLDYSFMATSQACQITVRRLPTFAASPTMCTCLSC